MQTKRMPRDCGGSIEIKDGTGPIRAMLSTGELFEIYKVDKTFRVVSPEQIDPGRTNPNAPFVVSPVQNIGTSNRIVARVLLQNHDIINSVFWGKREEKETIYKQLHQCKEALVRCEACAVEVSSKVTALIAHLEQFGVRLENGRALNPFPQVEQLEQHCSTYLIEANRAIKAISGLPSLFFSLPVIDTNFDFLHSHLTSALGETEPLCTFVQSTSSAVRRLVEMRNFLEHPKERRTVIENFHLLPDGTISSPTWYLTGEQPVPIAEEMAAAIDFLVGVSERIVMHSLVRRGAPLPFEISRIPEDEIDKDFPVRYRVTFVH